MATESQIEVLRLGLNFAPAPNKVPIRDFIAAVETAAEKLGDNEGEDLRMRICGVMRKAKPPVSNMSKHQRIALKELKWMNNVVILPADKGNATVLMTMQRGV